MSIHAVDKNMLVGNIVIEYRDRPQNSVSKLNTYSDGIKVLKTILKLYKNYKPMGFFGIIALVMALISTSFFIPVFIEFTRTGKVPNFPTLIMCGFTMVAAIQSFFAGMVLQTILQKNRQDFEINFQRAAKDKKDIFNELKI